MLETVLTSIVTSLATTLGLLLVEEKRLRREFEMDRERIRTEFMAEGVAKQLLNAEKWKQRSFEAIQRRLGGFQPDELRKILVRAGAVKFEGKAGEELWGLLERNKDSL
jgi:predicted Holliday junction resolvase-like endonuclease